MSGSTSSAEQEYDRKGLLLGAGAYLAWVVFPLYFKLLAPVPPLEILTYRFVWSLLFMAIVITWLRRWGNVRRAIRQRAVLRIYTISGLLLAVNWYVYIWAVNNNHVLDGSLGYFINPLVNVVLGMLFLGERLRRGQVAALALAASAVGYLTWNYGQLPWIALTLALSFGFYGLVKKRAPLPAAEGMTVETGVLFVPALVILIWFEAQGTGAWAVGGMQKIWLLMLAGPITAIPLLMFAAAAQRVPLSVLGVLQYIAPTGQFLIAVLVFNEPFPHYKMVGFAIIWVALILFWVENLVYRRRLLGRPAVVKASVGTA